MDPYSMAVIGLSTAALNAYAKGMEALIAAPPEYRDQFYKRLMKIEALGDPLLDLLTDVLAKLAKAAKKETPDA